MPPATTTTHSTDATQQRNQLNDGTINQIEPLPADAISTIATSSETNTDALACYYKNCSISNSLNYNKSNRKNDVVFQTPQHSRARKQHQVDSNTSLIRNQSSNAILPPPLFDENPAMSTATLPLLPNDSVRQLKSRRNHRTIPRHFTLGTMDTSNSASHKAKQDDPSKPAQNCTNNNKKSVCQCPVQHVPMTYMGSAHLNLSRTQQPNELLLSTLTKKWPHHKSNVAKSASFTNTSTPTTNLSAPTAQGYNRNSASGLLSATNPPLNQTSATNPTTSTIQTNNLQQQTPKTPSKIITISKQIGNVSMTQSSSQTPPLSTAPTNESMLELLPINIQNKAEHSNTNAGGHRKSSNASIIDSNDILTSSYPMTPIDGIMRSSKKELITNPALPPKMCKERSNQR